MKIQLVQSEIETAIANYIRETITVNEGMAITMELRATRGAEGFQAEIDISPATKVAVEVQKPAVAAPVARTAVKTATVGQPTAQPATKAAAPAPQPQPEPEPEEPESQPDTSAAEGVGQPEEQVEDAQEASAGADAEQTTTVEPAADPAPVKRSLFAGLKKPANQPS